MTERIGRLRLVLMGTEFIIVGILAFGLFFLGAAVNLVSHRLIGRRVL